MQRQSLLVFTKCLLILLSLEILRCDDSIATLYEQASISATAFDVESAWYTARTVDSSTITAAISFATLASNVSLVDLTVKVIEIPAGNFSVFGNLTVPAGIVLVFRGTGGLLVPQAALPVPQTFLLTGDASSGRIAVSPGKSSKYR